MRYFLDIAYKGTNYHGWQIQPNAHTVQAEIESALEKLYRKKVGLTASGRTDTGVHANQQIAHFDADNANSPEKITYRLNAILPNDVVIKGCKLVKDDAHARFDATERAYVYRIKTARDPFGQNEWLYVPYALDLDKMNAAAETLLGQQDFESFSRVKTEVNHFICDLRSAYWEPKKDELVFHVHADRFLRGMIRALVGTLLEVGRGKLSIEEFVAIREAKNRQKAGKAASPDGLYLNSVKYAEEIYL